MDLAAIPRSVERAGFRAGTMWIVAVGEATTTAEGRPAFRLRHWPEPIALQGTAPPGDRPARFVVDGSGGTPVLRPEPRD